MRIVIVILSLQVDRSHGDLSAVTVYWEVDPSSEGQLLTTFGNITFRVGQTSENITVSVAQDEIPELDKNVTVSLVNVSYGRLGDQTSATLTLLASDDPYGVFVFSNKTRSVRLPEANSIVSLTILRQKGLMGQVSCLDSFRDFVYFHHDCFKKAVKNWFQCKKASRIDYYYSRAQGFLCTILSPMASCDNKLISFF